MLQSVSLNHKMEHDIFLRQSINYEHLSTVGQEDSFRHVALLRNKLSFNSIYEGDFGTSVNYYKIPKSHRLSVRFSCDVHHNFWGSEELLDRFNGKWKTGLVKMNGKNNAYLEDGNSLISSPIKASTIEEFGYYSCAAVYNGKYVNLAEFEHIDQVYFGPDEVVGNVVAAGTLIQKHDQLFILNK
uniref:Ig-like domain-containing protein n=1 Tax=Rhabditophanes sp. KR3021 TaxID=114890 RepID=A0AC35U1B0_9BILA